MAINERLVHTASASAAAGTGNQEEGLMLHLDANDVDSYDGDGDVWYDIHDHEYTPATNVSEHFNTVTYTGSGDTANGQSITGVGFQPDLVWMKSTGTTYNHVLYDSLRGVNSAISTNLTDAAWANHNRFESFDSDGFSIEADNSADLWKIDRVSQPYAAWCFKAGGLKNKAAGFNGSSSNIDISGNPLGVNDFTYSVWFNAGTVSVANQNIITSNAGHVNYGLQVTGTGVSMYALNSSGGAEYLVSNTGLVSAGTWYHIAYVKSSISGHSLYLNGNVVASDSAFTGNCASGTGNETTIGSANNNIQWFNGKISQVRLFNSALTSSQITQLYNETPEENNGHLLGCVAAFPLNDNANEIDNNYTATASNVTFGLPGYANRNNEGTTESTVSANNDLGFSVVKYNGLNTAVTAGHGLESPPEMVICKPLAAGAWAVWHKDMASDLDKNYIPLTTGATTPNASSLWNYSNWGATKIGSSNPLMFGTNNDIIAYCFTSKRGVSKVGSYIGTGAAGNKVYTGFEPAFIMTKRSSTSGDNWNIIDNVRDTDTNKNAYLKANTNGIEVDSSTSITFNRDGFTLNGGSFNTSSQTHIYYAVAKDTNETQLADTVGFKPSIDPDDHFNTVIWNGGGLSSVAITGVGFQPDLVWVKQRNLAQYHSLSNSISGVGKMLWPNASDAEYSTTTYGQIASFDSDGFTANKGSDPTYSYFNISGGTYVAWCFNAGGNEVTNTEGTIDSTVRANNDLGFSVATYTGVGYPASSTAEIGHGLDSAPELVIIKGTGGTGQSGGAGSWVVGSSLLGNGWDGSMYLNDTAGYYTANNYFWNGAATSSVIKLKNDWFVNGVNNNYVAYSFASKRGVSKVGSYVGDGGTSNKIFTEFEPAFVMIKRTDSTSNWRLFDNTRGTEKELYANTNAQEPSDVAYINFNRDGFTLTSNGGWINNSNGEFIYYAVAKNTNNEQPHLELNLEADSYSGSGDWLDSSGNVNNGTITGATHNDELGDFFDFNGSSDKVKGNISGIGSQFTIELWVSPNDFTGNENLIELYDSATDASNNRIFFSSGSLLASKNGGGGGFAQKTSISSVMTIGKWHHVVARYDGNSSIKLYVDTVKIAEDLSVSGTFNIAEFAIGVNDDYTQGERNFANAKIGQVRVYNTILSEAQIRQNYNFTKPKYPNEFNGTISNATWNAGGYFNFDGSNDKIATTYTRSGKAFSFSCWVNTTDDGQRRYIFGDFNSAGADASGSVFFRITGGDNLSLGVGNGSITNTKALTDGMVGYLGYWTHLAVTIDGTSGKIYRNGTLVKSDTFSISMAPGQNPICIGHYSVGASGGEFNGSISDVKMFDKALTASEVTAQYNIGYNGIG